MCRLAAWRGDSIPLKDIVEEPSHSLLHQSNHAAECKTATNGDGFGIAWYDRLPEAGVYRDTHPAWADANLKSLCRQISARTFLAHVRAATHGETSRANCHPFTHGRWSFMHNGQIANFEALRRRLESELDDEHYRLRQGTTDSEMLFLLTIQTASRNGGADPVDAAAFALQRVAAAAERAGIVPFVRFTSVLCDGEALYAIRYATDDRAPSLYLRERETGVAIASEPLDGELSGWASVPANSWLRIGADGIFAGRFDGCRPDLRRAPAA